MSAVTTGGSDRWERATNLSKTSFGTQRLGWVVGWEGPEEASRAGAHCSGLLSQKSRYGTYAALLRVKMKAASEELDTIEAALAQAGSTEDGCPPPHSSPPLQTKPTSQPRAQRPGSEARAGAGSARPKP